MKTAKIIILAGQSNAVGVGYVDYLKNHFSNEKTEEYINGYENILINYFSHDKRSNGFVKTSVGCTEIHKKTLGPEVGIAEALTEKYAEEKLYIVKCAYGGTNLYHDWMSPSNKDYDKLSYGDGDTGLKSDYDKGDGHFRASGWCFNELVRILNESIAILKNQGLSPEITGFCWMQGESDADTKDHASQYEKNYGTMLSDVKSIFGKYMAECKFIDAGISEIWPLYEDINEIKKAYAEKTESCYYIDTIAEGLATHNEPQPEVDTAHYDSNCTVELGRLFAKFL